MKIVINRCYGGFGLSEKALKLYEELAQENPNTYNFERNCPHLVQVVEQLGKEANGDFSDLKIVEIPDGVEWCIEEYDGMEWVAEVHRTWS